MFITSGSLRVKRRDSMAVFLLMEVGFIPPELTTIPERASSSPFYNIHPHSL